MKDLTVDARKGVLRSLRALQQATTLENVKGIQTPTNSPRWVLFIGETMTHRPRHPPCPPCSDRLKGHAQRPQFLTILSSNASVVNPISIRRVTGAWSLTSSSRRSKCGAVIRRL